MKHHLYNIYHIYITTVFKLWLFILYDHIKQHFRGFFPSRFKPWNVRNLARWFSYSLFPLWSRHSLPVWSCSGHCRDLSSLLQEVSNSLWLQRCLLISCEKMSGKGGNTQGQKNPRKERDCGGREMLWQTVKPQSLVVLTLWHNLEKFLIMGETQVVRH